MLPPRYRARGFQGSPETASKLRVGPGKQELPGEKVQGQHRLFPPGVQDEAEGELPRKIHASQLSGQEGSQKGYYLFDPEDVAVHGPGQVFQGGARPGDWAAAQG